MSFSASSMHGGEGQPSALALDSEESGVEPTGATRPNAHLRDLAALLALPRMLRGRDPSFIGSTLLDVLVSLLRLDVAYIRISTEQDDAVVEALRPVGAMTAAQFGRTLGAETLHRESAGAHPHPVGADGVPLVRIDAQLDVERATVVVGSGRAGFPTDVDNFLCRAAIEQAMIAIHTSRLVESLKTANAAKATFLATMSHELRTPLNAIIGYSELLQAEIGGDLSNQHKQHVGRIGGAARHLLGLIESILNFARLEAGQEQLQLDTVEVGQIAGDVASLIEPLARGKGLDLRVSLRDAPFVIRSDAAKVRQILLNLLSNAVKFTSEGAVILDVRRMTDEVVCTVTDTGVGISEADLSAVFEPFRQVGQVHTQRAPGTGLGLSVSRQLARLLGGDVTVESTPGEGSSFMLHLPLRSDD